MPKTNVLERGLQQGVDEWDNVYERMLPPVPQLPASTPSQEKIIQKILTCFGDPEIGKIIISGPPGTGKRTIMEHVMNRARRLDLFEISVQISVIVRHSFGVEKVQKEIAKSLSLNIEKEQSEGSLARKIFAVLEKRRFVVSCYDCQGYNRDIFKVITRAGVPNPDQQNACKIVAVTGPQYEGDSDQRIKVEGLEKMEAWNLFLEKGDGLVDSPHIHPLVHEVVVECCDGLPLLINLVGGFMRNVKDVVLWQELSLSNVMEFYYDQIASDEIKKFLSYCCLFGFEYEMDVKELVGYWVVDGLINGAVELEEEGGDYAKGLSILKHLLDCCLLQRVGDNSVKIHYYIWQWLRDSIDSRFMVRYPWEHKKWETAERISLLETTRLPVSGPNCPKLLTLLLGGSPILREIPYSFFVHMDALRILRIYEAPIESLPPSLKNLHNLRALVLRDCKLFTTMPDLRALGKLEVLDVSGTVIESLPLSISALSSLQQLLVRDCPFLKTLPDLQLLEKLKILDLSRTPIESLPSSVSTLYNLQELLARDCFSLKIFPDLQELEKIEVLDLPVIEIKEFPDVIFKSTHLRHLNLDQIGSISSREAFAKWCGATIYVREANFFRTFRKDCPLPKCFNRFHFLIFHSSEGIVDDEDYFQRKHFCYNHIYLRAKNYPTYRGRERCLEINGSDSSWDDIVGVLNHADLLSLRDNLFLKNLSQLGIENLKGLRECRIERCHEMESFVGGGGAKDGKILESLENLWISNLLGLTSICSGTVLPGSFACLKQIYLDFCPRIEYVLSSSMVLEKLESLEIKFCDKLVKIFAEEMEAECVFPCLKSLFLWELPELKTVCKGNLPTTFERLDVKECPKLKKLPRGVYNATFPVTVRGEREWWKNLEWEDEGTKPPIRGWDMF